MSTSGDAVRVDLHRVRETLGGDFEADLRRHIWALIADEKAKAHRHGILVAAKRMGKAMDELLAPPAALDARTQPDGA